MSLNLKKKIQTKFAKKYFIFWYQMCVCLMTKSEAKSHDWAWKRKSHLWTWKKKITFVPNLCKIVRRRISVKNLLYTVRES